MTRLCQYIYNFFKTPKNNEVENLIWNKDTDREIKMLKSIAKLMNNQKYKLFSRNVVTQIVSNEMSKKLDAEQAKKVLAQNINEMQKKIDIINSEKSPDQFETLEFKQPDEDLDSHRPSYYF